MRRIRSTNVCIHYSLNIKIISRQFHHVTRRAPNNITQDNHQLHRIIDRIHPTTRIIRKSMHTRNFLFHLQTFLRTFYVYIHIRIRTVGIAKTHMFKKHKIFFSFNCTVGFFFSLFLFLFLLSNNAYLTAYIIFFVHSSQKIKKKNQHSYFISLCFINFSRPN